MQLAQPIRPDTLEIQMFLRSAFSFCSASPPCLQGLFCPKLLCWWKAAGLRKECQIPGRKRDIPVREKAALQVSEGERTDKVHHLSMLKDSSAEGTGSRLPFGNITLMSLQRGICWRCNGRNHWSNLWSSTWQAGEKKSPHPPPRFCFYISETKCVQNVFPHNFEFPNDYFHFEIHLSFCKVAFFLKN